jgi:hypothetical protein
MEELLIYLLGVEKTFWSPEGLYDEVKNLLVEVNSNVKRYYLLEAKVEGGRIIEKYGLQSDITNVILVERNGDVVKPITT